MLPQQLRQRGIYIAFNPGSAIVSSSCSMQPELRMAFSSDRRGKGRDASSARPGQGDATRSGAESQQDDFVARSAPTNAPAQPSAATATAMAGLRSRLAASHAVHERPRNPPAADAGSSSQSLTSTSAAQSSLQPHPTPARRQEATEFQGVPLQLGELGNPLQSMAVLTHTDVRQLTEYGKNLLESDQRFLSSLHKMAPVPQQRAAAIMQMAAGAVPPPAVLVWAAQEVVQQLRRVLRERLEVQQQQQQQVLKEEADVRGSAAGAAALAAEPWYEGALQLARLEKLDGRGAQPAASQPRPPLQPQQPPQPGAGQQSVAESGGGAPGTELELLRAFAAAGTRREEAGMSLSAAGAPLPQPQPQPYPEPRVVGWEALLALPQLHSLLEVAESRSPELAAVLRLSGLRPGPSPAEDPAPGGATAAAEVAASDLLKGKQLPKTPANQAAAPPAAVQAPGTSWLLPALRSAAAAARARALRVAGLDGSGAGEAGAPLDAEAALTALARGARSRPGAAAGADGGPSQSSAASAPSAEQRRRVAAADWLAAATLLRHAEERLGCAGGASGVRQEAVAALHLLGLPLEAQELPYMDELKVSEQEVLSWQAHLSALLAAAPGGPDGSAPPLPAALQSRLSAARQRLAASGRALALAAPEPATGEPDWSQEAVATRAWLRAVGTPLVSGLLSGGYGSLSRLRAMVPELREALVLRLLETGRVQGGTAALAAALYGDAEAAWRATRSDGAGAATASALLQREAVEAELDLLHDRYVAMPPAPPPAPLPSDAALAAAVQALPPPARTLYDSYYVLRGADDDADPAVLVERRRVAEALLGAEEGAVVAGLGDLKSWLSEARKGLLLLPAPLLALLLRFLRVQVSVTPDEARAQRTKLTALALLVAEQQRRAAAAVEGRAGGQATAAAAATVARELAEWSRSGGGGGTGGLVPAALAALLGSSAAMDFSSWLQAVALSSASVSRSTHALLAGQQLQMDVERYLAMTHDPRLHLPTSGLRPEGAASASSSPCRPTSTRWTEPALRRSEGEFLQHMRPQLDAYLQAVGHRPLGDAEWAVYRDAALGEWEAGREEREKRVAAAGQSGFFNPRADEVYLQQMVERGIPIGDPLGPQSRRYLDTLLKNPSWSFTQRRQAVQRLIQLNAHFARQPPASEGGSPFAPLFAVGGPDVVPRLGTLGQGEGAAGHRGAVAAPIGEAPQLPPGF